MVMADYSCQRCREFESLMASEKVEKIPLTFLQFKLRFISVGHCFINFFCLKLLIKLITVLQMKPLFGKNPNIIF